MRYTLLTFAVLVISAPCCRADDPPMWVAPMKKAHAKFTGKPGTLALFGDSITVSKAFWTPLAYAPKNLPDLFNANLSLVRKHMLDTCWSEWRGAKYGSEGGKTTQWALDHVDDWLKELNPEAVVLMFGTNDLNTTNAKDYEKQTRTLVETILKNGTVIILTTIPPRAGMEEKAAAFAEAQRKVAAEFKLPLIDYHAEILKRRPKDWNGKLPQFKETATQNVYEVPTLISGDGVHPSNPAKFKTFTDESLNHNGYLLRSVLTLNAYADVIRHVLKQEK